MGKDTSEVDYTAMSAPQMIEACGDDARAWAQAFMQIVSLRQAVSGNGVIDEDVMTHWFSNVIRGARE